MSGILKIVQQFVVQCVQYYFGYISYWCIEGNIITHFVPGTTTV